MKSRVWPFAALIAAVLLVPQVVWAASASYTSSSASTAAVKGTNSSGGSGAKGVVGYASSTGTGPTFGVYGLSKASSGRGAYGEALGTNGIGVYGRGAKYGLYSRGDLGIIAGKALVCDGCVGASDVAPNVATQAELDANTAAASDAFENYGATVGSSCTNLASITLNVPAAGTVQLMANPHIYLQHTNGTADSMVAGWGTTASDCGFDDADGLYTMSGVYQVPSAAATGDYYTTVPAMANVSASAGAVTYYLNAAMEFGASAGDKVLRSQMFANFIG